MDETVDRLRAEGEALDVLVAPLAERDWRRFTPAAGWTIAHQIAHLQWTDEVAILALRHPETLAAIVRRAVAEPALVDDEAAQRARLDPANLLDRWRRGRAELARALRDAPSDTSVPWFGPPMRPRSMATARLMETWAHGQDVADALGVRREPTGRLRDIAHLGVRTRDFAYRINQLEPPADEFRVELTGPDGEDWAWGPAGAHQRVAGPAEGFCLVVTQRRELGDVDLTVTGEEAARWLTIAQAFAGPPKSVARQAGSGQPPNGPTSTDPAQAVSNQAGQESRA
jgi:uncharacterized protein (TIGR03084 family)